MTERCVKFDFVILRPSTTWQNVADRLLRSGAATVFCSQGVGKNPCGFGETRNFRSGDAERLGKQTRSIYWVIIRVIYESGLTRFNLFSNIFHHSFFTTSALPATCQENAVYHH